MSDYKKLGNEHLTNAVCLADKIIHLNIKFRVAEEIGVCVCVRVLVTQLCLTPFNPKHYSPPGSSIVEFSRRKYWNGLRFPSPGGLPNAGIGPPSPILQADCLLSEPPEKMVRTTASSMVR